MYVQFAFMHNPAEGDTDIYIAPGTEFKDVPEIVVFPVRVVTKEDFEP